MNGIVIKELTKSFQGKKVIDSVTVDFDNGAIHGIVGRNGSGKTVFMRLISGMYRINSGSILVFGKYIGKEIEHPDSMGILIDAPGFIPFYSGYQNLKILAEIKNRIGRNEINATMQAVGLDPSLKLNVSRYSMGMRQRLALAQAIMESPQLMLLDEPFNGLDKSGVVEMRKLIKSLRKENTLVLLSSHNPQDIDELCDTVHEIDSGKLVKIR